MTATSIELWGPFAVAFVAAAASLLQRSGLAPKIGAMEIPRMTTVHQKPMPRFGGIAIYIGIMIALAVFALHDRSTTAIMAGCTMIYVLGLVDDLRNLKPAVKLAGQIACAAVVFAMGVRIEFITNYFGPGNMIFGDTACCIITIIWLVAITNAVNLIDGLDGLAAGITGHLGCCARICVVYTRAVRSDAGDDGNSRSGSWIPAV